MFQPFKTTAVFEGGNYKHFHINKITASIFGNKPEDIIEVEVSIHENQTPVKPNTEQDSTNPDYWGYWDNELNNMWHIYPAYFLLDMCFPSGIKVYEERGFGKAYRLNINKI